MSDEGDYEAVEEEEDEDGLEEEEEDGEDGEQLRPDGMYFLFSFKFVCFTVSTLWSNVYSYFG